MLPYACIMTVGQVRLASNVSISFSQFFVSVNEVCFEPHWRQENQLLWPCLEGLFRMTAATEEGHQPFPIFPLILKKPIYTSRVVSVDFLP